MQLAEQTVSAFRENRLTLGLVSMDIQQHFLQGARLYLMETVASVNNEAGMGDADGPAGKAHDLLKVLDSITTLTTAIGSVWVNPEA